MFREDNTMLHEPFVLALRLAALVYRMGVITALLKCLSHMVLGVAAKKGKFVHTKSQQ
jgi:hypothetical protein